MSQKTLIAPTTAASSEPKGFNTNAYASCSIVADALAGAEEVDIYMRTNGTWEPVVNASGETVKLTATQTMIGLEPGPVYGVDKDSTAGACGVYLNRTRRLRS